LSGKFDSDFVADFNAFMRKRIGSPADEDDFFDR
jgi:hypothetical protein